MEYALSIGNFDGLHIGHRKLLTSLQQEARALGLRTMVITFDNHPAQILRTGNAAMILTPAQHKKVLIQNLGIDKVELLHFDQTLAHTTAEDFLHDFVIPSFHPKMIVVGYDSHFGYQREGDFSFLQSHAPTYGYGLRNIEPVIVDGITVSSSLIRNLLIEGEIVRANKLLAAPYTLYGTVVRGRGVGTKLGFPTANMRLDESQQLLPRRGIYASSINIEEDRFLGLTIIGISPTLKQDGIVDIENHILDFNRDVYGKTVSVKLLSYLREEKLFATQDALIQAIKADVQQARSIHEGKRYEEI